MLLIYLYGFTSSTESKVLAINWRFNNLTCAILDLSFDFIARISFSQGLRACQYGVIVITLSSELIRYFQIIFELWIGALSQQVTNGLHSISLFLFLIPRNSLKKILNVSEFPVPPFSIMQYILSLDNATTNDIVNDRSKCLRYYLHPCFDQSWNPIFLLLNENSSI